MFLLVIRDELVDPGKGVQARDGRFEHPGGGGSALVFAVRPAKVLAFAKGQSGQTRHRLA